MLNYEYLARVQLAINQIDYQGRNEGKRSQPSKKKNSSAILKIRVI